MAMRQTPEGETQRMPGTAPGGIRIVARCPHDNGRQKIAVTARERGEARVHEQEDVRDETLRSRNDPARGGPEITTEDRLYFEGVGDAGAGVAEGRQDENRMSPGCQAGGRFACVGLHPTDGGWELRGDQQNPHEVARDDDRRPAGCPRSCRNVS